MVAENAHAALSEAPGACDEDAIDVFEKQPREHPIEPLGNSPSHTLIDWSLLLKGLDRLKVVASKAESSH